jgi:hypothetical protein
LTFLETDKTGSLNEKWRQAFGKTTPKLNTSGAPATTKDSLFPSVADTVVFRFKFTKQI